MSRLSNKKKRNLLRNPVPKHTVWTLSVLKKTSSCIIRDRVQSVKTRFVQCKNYPKNKTKSN